ncbi:uncharacterized protein LOC109720721 [Ananas comosus]|uniref:Uncharacterized protein LOC109720721 n=1 Tax=Ananas comosus TaxID=4615 RepID=A0A6P5G5L5_ANACO|nr:uncharacterized protein LOC109720721 [Ananas comosus]
METLKNSYGILGTASPSFLYTSLSNTSDTLSIKSVSHLPPCVLNHSPWDDLYPDHPDSDHQQIQGEEKHDVMIMESDPEGEEVKNNNLNLFESAIEIMEDQERQKGKDKASKRRMKTEKEKPHIASSSTITKRVCEYNDRKIWKYKGETHLTGSFCHCHHKQLRPHNYTKICTALKANCQNKKKKKKNVAKRVFDSSSEYYYYYAGFGPCRAKERRTRGHGSEKSMITKNTDKQLVCTSVGDGDDDHENINQQNDLQADNDNKGKVKEKETEKKVRKPIKFRSLGSFL